LKRKERETGIEPATSSLGKWTTIESKEQPGLWHAFLAQEIAAVSYFWIRAPLNGIQTGYTLFHLYPGRSSLRYSVNGKQYIAVAAGNTLFAFALRQ
jgi:hypothetical protein